ncbi:MAG: hypothetical protein SAL70_21405 [Scytonema sp. PMC 1070.18]|nr:hypothetical protein [Scytonema sp. PMC 1070.18]
MHFVERSHTVFSLATNNVADVTNELMVENKFAQREAQKKNPPPVPERLHKWRAERAAMRQTGAKIYLG